MTKRGALVVLLVALAWLSVALQTRARAQEMTHSHPTADQALHDKFYSTWIRPDVPEWGSCCNNQDCYPTEMKHVGRKWLAQRREDGEWVEVPAEKFEHNRVDGLPRSSPDGRNHVCMNPQGFVFCAILGGGT